MILADLPYGTTANKWDSVIAFGPMWVEFLRVCKPSAAIVLTASQPFTSALVMSQPKLFRHEWVWEKSRASNFLNSVREPMKRHESVLIFSRGKWTYNSEKDDAPIQSAARKGEQVMRASVSDNYGETTRVRTYIFTDKRMPSSIRKFASEVGLHPTQKPVDLMRYMIRTYTNPGETVLDVTMGSGTTGVAAVMENRRFVGIELDPKYFMAAQIRIFST